MKQGKKIKTKTEIKITKTVKHSDFPTNLGQLHGLKSLCSIKIQTVKLKDFNITVFEQLSYQSNPNNLKFKPAHIILRSSKGIEIP